MTPLTSSDSILVFLSMLAVTYSARLAGFSALHSRTLSKRAVAMVETAPGCMPISVIASYFIFDKPRELTAITLTVLAASHLSMLPAVLIGVAASGLFGYLLQ